MEVRKLGGVYLKLTGIKGIPDRIVLLPGGKVGFIELKALGDLNTSNVNLQCQYWMPLPGH
ncbi:MAG: hypothetical protein RSB90_09290 [Eubacterium sp.]